MQTQTFQPVIKHLDVRASQARCFEVFTQRMDTWWPKSHSLGKSPQQAIVIEPHTGGRWYEKLEDGSECSWGRVLCWEPNGRVVLSWQLDGEWAYDPDPSHASELELLFTAESDLLTRVQLTHGHFENHGAGAAAVHRGVSSDGGWNSLVTLFVAAVEA